MGRAADHTAGLEEEIVVGTTKEQAVQDLNVYWLSTDTWPGARRMRVARHVLPGDREPGGGEDLDQ